MRIIYIHWNLPTCYIRLYNKAQFFFSAIDLQSTFWMNGKKIHGFCSEREGYGTILIHKMGQVMNTNKDGENIQS